MAPEGGGRRSRAGRVCHTKPRSSSAGRDLPKRFRTSLRTQASSSTAERYSLFRWAFTGFWLFLGLGWVYSAETCHETSPGFYRGTMAVSAVGLVWWVLCSVSVRRSRTQSRLDKAQNALKP